MGEKIRVMMICAHEPSLDPRIRWEAEAAAHRFEVTVLGFNRPDGSCPSIEVVNNYRITRLPPIEVSALYYFWRLKDIMPRRLLVFAAVLAVALVPMLVVAEFLVRLIRWSARCIAHWAVWVMSKSVVLSLLIRPLRNRLSGIRGLLLARAHFVVAVLRVQFAPAVSAFWDHLREAPEKPDVIHCNDLDTLLVGVLAKRRYGCRLIYDAHEFYPRSDPAGRWLDITFFSTIERMLIRKADAVVTVNPPLAEAMRAAYRLPKVHAVANAEPWVGTPAKRIGSNMDRLAAGRCKFLFQGRFTPGRGIDELIEAWARVDGTRAALFLRGPDNMWRHGAITLAADLGLLDRSIYFLDAVSEDQLVAAATEADVGIIPYRPLIINDRLSCPNKLSQYLHAGLMVLANDLTYVRSVLSEAQAGLFYDSARPATLAEAVHRVVDNPELLRRGRENAVRYARDRFNWQIEGERLYALYYPPGGETEPVLPAAVAVAAS
jgi:glycosyltransferase involved in cell wall biosynthesis